MEREREILYLLQLNCSVLSVAEIMISNLKMLLLAAVSCLFACLFVCFRGKKKVILQRGTLLSQTLNLVKLLFLVIYIQGSAWMSGAPLLSLHLCLLRQTTALPLEAACRVGALLVVVLSV